MTDLIIAQVLAYLVSIAAGLRTEAISEKRQRELREALETRERELLAVNSRKSLTEQLTEIGGRVAEVMTGLGIETPVEQALFGLLADPGFRTDLADWLLYRDLREAADARRRLEERMAECLTATGATDEQVDAFRRDFFYHADNVLFADGKLARWRDHLALRAIREEHDEILRRLREADGEFEPQRLREAMDRYREVALNICDIIDLAGLPEDDRHLAMQNFVLRQLYIPLRVEAEASVDDEVLERWEEEREARRLEAAGRDVKRRTGKEDRRVAVGELLKADRRLVILGDPGSGKTTLTRWLATAYLLRLKSDADLKALPDVATLPDADWLPIVIRCRELPHDAHTCAFDDVMGHVIRAQDLSPDLHRPLLALLRERLEEGTALLMIDGLDEIRDPMLRARFCRRLETLAAVYERAPIVVTSRIVGYREMRFRMGRGFRHASIAELTAEEMDEFAHRWAEATELAPRRDRSAQELIDSIHSSERVERLAGNPMLLTTLALVHRKIGRLPQRRVELYREALQVLLNWRGEIDERLDWDEAVPQLEYVAYAMCRDGVQQLPKDRVLELLEEMREQYRRRLRDVLQRTPREFLELLERRSSLLVEAGHVRIDGREVPVYEFRHLTFQEYLAGLALVDGRFPGHEKGVRLAGRVAPLAGVVREQETRLGPSEYEYLVTENWREPLRLCLAACNDDDVDDALLAILNPAEGEDAERLARPRAIMAALCLADEPNVSEEVAAHVLQNFAAQVAEGDGNGPVLTALDAAAMEVACCDWRPDLSKALVREFRTRGPKNRHAPGGLCGMVNMPRWPQGEKHRKEWLANLVEELSLIDEDRAIEGALTVMAAAYEEKAVLVPRLVESLLFLLSCSGAASHAAAWALGWLSNPEVGVWKPRRKEVEPLLQLCTSEGSDVEALICSIYVLGWSGDSRATEVVTPFLGHRSQRVRQAAVGALASLHELKKTEKKLVAANLEHLWASIDPREPITAERVAEASRMLKLPEKKIRRLYEGLAPQFRLRLAWRS